MRIEKNDINRAIRKIREFGLYHAIEDLPHSTCTVQAFELAIKALENELERVGRECDVCKENKILDSCIIDEYRYISCGNDAGTHCERNEYELSVRSGNMPMIQVCLKGEECVDSNILEYKINYCPSCGAKMKGENNA